jgi:alkylation response protein AidB-like acyl-CoA dehydrogenase
MLQEEAPAMESQRFVHAHVAQQLAREGFFRQLVPQALGGEEVHAADFVRILATLAEGDAASAWCVMTGATTGLLSAYIDPQGADELWARHPDVIMSGIFAPMGRATPVDGGYKLSGRWPFASGSHNSQWHMVGGLVIEGGAPRMMPSGAPEIRSFFLPTEQIKPHDTWHVSGLCATGSRDVDVEDAFIPAHRTLSLMSDAPQFDIPLYQFPVFGLLSSGVTAVALGIARTSINACTTIAQKKRRPGSKNTMAHQEHTQITIAQAETKLQAATQYLLHTLERVWDHAQQHGSIGDQEKASVRMAANFGTETAVDVVDAMYRLAGGSAIYQTNPLQRHFRDVHTITQHVMVTPMIYKTAGRVLLGIPTDTSQL